MAKKNDIKKISITQLENIMKEKDNGTTTVEWNGIELVVKNSLSIADVKLFTDTVVNACVYDDGSYFPEIKDLATSICIISLYGNIRLPQDISRAYDIIINTGVAEEIVKYINIEQLNKIQNAIDAKIDYKLNSNIKAVENKIDAMVSTLEEIGDKAEEIFSNLGDDGLNNLVNSVGNLDMNGEKIIHDYIDMKLEE